MKIEAYLKRINYAGPLAVNSETLRQLHRAHLHAIPYENLDIHLGRRLTLDLSDIYTKIVGRRRGGWCYEMNGLFAWALEELGFTVKMLGSSVGQPAQGGVDGDLDHLILRVDLEQPWLADVGFGNGLVEPLPLRPGTYEQGALPFGLEQEGDAWFFRNQAHDGAGYGFTLLPRQFAGFAPRCHELQTSPDSGFVRSTVCHFFTSEGRVSLRGAVLKHFCTSGIAEEEIDSHHRYEQVLRDIFGLDLPDTGMLWDAVWQRHLVWKQEQENAHG